MQKKKCTRLLVGPKGVRFGPIFEKSGNFCEENLADWQEFERGMGGGRNLWRIEGGLRGVRGEEEEEYFRLWFV
jgi:hypothetical protein